MQANHRSSRYLVSMNALDVQREQSDALAAARLLDRPSLGERVMFAGTLACLAFAAILMVVDTKARTTTSSSTSGSFASTPILR